MRVVVSDSAADLIDERGGSLYVWPKRGRCCGSVTRLMSASAAPPRVDFRRVEECSRFALYLPSLLARRPDELEIDIRRFPRRVEAYWNGCAWMA